RELAAAAGRTSAEVEALIDRGRIATIDGRFIAHAEALRVGRAIRAGQPLGVVVTPPPLFTRAGRTTREAQVPLVASTAIHGTILGALLLIPLLGRAEISSALTTARLDPVRLVFLATPGPGGGGGGGGLRQPKAPPAAG